MFREHWVLDKINPLCFYLKAPTPHGNLGSWILMSKHMRNPASFRQTLVSACLHEPHTSLGHIIPSSINSFLCWWRSNFQLFILSCSIPLHAHLRKLLPNSFTFVIPLWLLKPLSTFYKLFAEGNDLQSDQWGESHSSASFMQERDPQKRIRDKERSPVRHRTLHQSVTFK